MQDGACYKDTTVPSGVIAVTQQDDFFFFLMSLMKLERVFMFVV